MLVHNHEPNSLLLSAGFCCDSHLKQYDCLSVHVCLPSPLEYQVLFNTVVFYLRKQDHNDALTYLDFGAL